MKRILSMILALLCLNRSTADTQTEFLRLTGLDRMFAAVQAGESVACIRYSDNAGEGVQNDFVTRDPEEIDAILKTLQYIRVVKPTDEFKTDWYPALRFTLSGGSEYTLSFDWEWLEADGVNYELEDADELWGTLDDIAAKYTTGEERKEKVMEAVYIGGSLGSIYGELTVPAGKGQVPLVILSHGFGGNRLGQQDYARYFQQQGFATYNFDFCGGGFSSRSDGTMTQMSVLTEAADLEAILDRFANDARFGDIFLWGASQGGFVSTYVAAKHPALVRALAIEFPAYVLQDDAKKVQLPDGSFPETYQALGVTIGRIYGQDAVSFDIYEVMKAYPGDVLILHGDRDGLVPISYSQRALDAFPSSSLVVMKGQNHGFSGSSRTQAMQQEAEFMLSHTAGRK